jgi:hypothetical protein
MSTADYLDPLSTTLVVPPVIPGLVEISDAPTSIRRDRREVCFLDPVRIADAKEGFATRRVPKDVMRTLISGSVRPRAGDLVLARVERPRQHKRLELPSGRKVKLEPGWEIVLACGNRYATDQFEGFVPDGLGRANLIAAGGIAGVEAERARGIRRATEITLLGLIGDADSNPLNLRSFALPAPEVKQPRPPVVAVFGASMNSGKTTAARFLCVGLRAAGFKVGYAKITGTGAGGDYWSLVDAGALVVDFTDAGLASTYNTPIPVLLETAIRLVGHLTAQGCERIVVEIADGLLQRETSALMHSRVIHSLVDRVLYAVGDPIAAMMGVQMLEESGFDVAGATGLVTASPLPAREAKRALHVPVWSREDLSDPVGAASIARPARGKNAEAPAGGN